MSDAAVLDDPVGESLRGAHAHLARRLGCAATYPLEMASFAAVPVEPTRSAWADLARLVGRGELADLFSAAATPPDGWMPVFGVDGVQMVAPPGAGGDGPQDVAIVELGAADVPEMLELAELTRPGPFWRRTVEFGGYLGIRDGGALVAMAGERLRPPGWTEISAVCTAPRARGRGYAAALVQAATRRISERGERAFLHVVAHNTGAIDLYTRLGFSVRRPVRFSGYRVP